MIAMQDAEAAMVLEGRPAEEILAWASARFGPRITFATGFGAEGCVLIDLIARHHLPIDIFTLDTGLLFPETYALWRRLEQRYGVVIRAVRPEQTVDQQAAAHGDRLWARDPDRCCDLRKVAPLRAALAGHDAWISAIRRDQTPERASAGIVEADAIFGLVKVNPLASWTATDVSDHVRAHDVPVSPLHEQGYPSIGCVPCTSRVAAGENPRAGRWRGRATSECGLHARPVTPRFTLAPHQARKTITPEKLVSPHGGALVDRIATPAEADALRERASRLPALSLDAREIADLELIATGAASPLKGFLGSADYESVLGRLRLANDTVWPLPLTLAVADGPRGLLEPGREAALFDSQGRLWGVVAVSEVFRRDPQHESRLVYGTEDPSHPGVAYLLSRPRWLVAGDVLVLPLPDDLPFAERRLTPRRLRDEIQARGWRHVAGFQTRNPIHRTHEHMTKLALEFADGLVIHPLVGETKNDDVPASVRFRAYEVLVDKYYPPGRTLLAAFPAAMRYAGPREALFHALVRKNYGIDRLIVGRDHAGVGEFYGPYEAQEIFDRFSQEELGVAPLKFEPTFFCRDCDALASPRTCPHDAASRLDLSGSKIRELLRNGRRLPEEFTRPEIAEILREYYERRAS
jgi:sulfate adenylyltransferase